MSDTKKELGQHWLTDDFILEEIVQSGEVNSEDFVLEIGPGKGTLTKKLVDSEAEVLALEFDKDLIKDLETQFANCNKFAIKHGDIRTFDYTNLPKDFKIVANIPYYLTSNLIRAISETSNPPSVAILLVQKEVAERLCAAPGDLSILGVTAQFYFECNLGVLVEAEYFTPPPKVDSQVVIMKRRDKALFDVDEKDFFRFIKAGFSEKRKNLRNSLSGGLRIQKDAAEKLLASVDVDLNTRAQELSLEKWFEIYTSYKNS